MISDEANYLAISGIQHFYFYRRQWALIYLERQWAENTRTFGGGLMHKNADDPFFTECRGNILISRGMPLISHTLRLQGIADVVEFHRGRGSVVIDGREGQWSPIPVEYKYGQPKEDDTDIVQLTVQAICLEEMLHTEIPSGFIYYGKTRQRIAVTFTPARRNLVEALCAEMYGLLKEGKTPAAEYKKFCKHCSMYNLCVPELTKRKKILKNYITQAIADTEDVMR